MRRSFLAGVGPPASSVHITAGRYAAFSCSDRSTRFRYSSRSFPGVLNIQQFDPLITPYYMGDYLANVSDGGCQFFAWGDNRDRVHNWLYPNGRHDPNVYFARR
jgi:hypothetical protein